MSSTAEPSHTPCDRPFHHSLCWGAVLAGTVVAIAIHVLLTALGVGAGLRIFRPVADTIPAAHFSAGAALAWSLFAIIAVSFGGLGCGTIVRLSAKRLAAWRSGLGSHFDPHPSLALCWALVWRWPGP